jgi:hypothetical protein
MIKVTKVLIGSLRHAGRADDNAIFDAQSAHPIIPYTR